MTISLHIVVDNAPDESLDRAVTYLKRVKPRTVDIAAGAQLDRGMQYAERVRAEVPGIKVFWRNLDPEDTGIHAEMSAQAVYDLKVAKHRAWFQKHQTVFMPDNESSGDDAQIKRYAAWQVEMAKLLHNDGLRGAFCRFATGNIDEGAKVSNQYPLLKPIFDVMLPGDYISPNEYSAQPGFPGGSGGNLERYKLMWAVAGKPLPTVIGEAGIAMNYNPGLGYIDAGMSDAAFGQQMIDEEIWYLDGEIDRHLYLMGGYSHKGYRLRDGVLEYLENYYDKAQPPIIITTPETSTPAPEPLSPSVPLPHGEGSKEPTWMDGLTKAEQARIDLGILLLKYGEELRSFIVDDDAYKLIAKLALMLGTSDKADS